MGEEILLLFEEMDFIFCEALLVQGIAFERERVDWVLGMLFMIDIVLAVVPVGVL